jgi:class 3 adenylate cyclase
MGCTSSKQNAQPAAPQPLPTDSQAKGQKGDPEKAFLLATDSTPATNAGVEKEQASQLESPAVKEIDLKELWTKLVEVEVDQASQDDLFQKLQSQGACMIVTVEIDESDKIRMITILQYLRALFAVKIWNAEVRLVKSDGNRFFIFASSPGEALRAALSMKLSLSTFHTWLGDVCPKIGALAKPATMKVGIHSGGILLIPEDCFGDPVNVASKLGEDIANSCEILVSAASAQHDSMKELMTKCKATSKQTTISGLTLEYNIIEVQADTAVPAITMPSAEDLSAHIKNGNADSKTEAQNVAILTTDMSGFTRLTKTYGILHFLRLVMKARAILLPEMAKVGGFKVKYEGDNIIGAFPNADASLACVKACVQQIREYNASREKDFQVRIGFGLDIGEVKIMGEDVIGEAFESSFKLAEDLAEVGEVLVTENMKAACLTSIESNGKLSDCKEIEGTGCKYYVLVLPSGTNGEAPKEEVGPDEIIQDTLPAQNGLNEIIQDDLPVQNAAGCKWCW